MIHTQRFLELTLLLSAASCGGSQAVERPRASPLAPRSDAESSTASPSVPAPEVETVATAAASEASPVEPSSCNDEGDVAVCSLLAPTCEGGQAQACRDLPRLVRPKIVERIARCIAQQQHHGRCAPAAALRSCFKSALQNGCTDPGADAVCRDLQAQCRAAGKNPTYSVAACAKVVSAVRARPGTADWHDADLDMLGPVDERDSCSLAGILPYQPFDR